VPVGRNLTPGEIAAVFATRTQDTTPAGIRHTAGLALLRLGLRRQEVAGLALDDCDQAEETVKVRGKGDKERLVPLTSGALAVT